MASYEVLNISQITCVIEFPNLIAGEGFLRQQKGKWFNVIDF